MWTDKRPSFFPPPSFLTAAAPLQEEEEETLQTLQVKPWLSASDGSNCIMRLSWSFVLWLWKKKQHHNTGLAWASQNNATFEVFVVVPGFFFCFFFPKY